MVGGPEDGWKKPGKGEKGNVVNLMGTPLSPEEIERKAAELPSASSPMRFRSEAPQKPLDMERGCREMASLLDTLVRYGQIVPLNNGRFIEEIARYAHLQIFELFDQMGGNQTAWLANPPKYQALAHRAIEEIGALEAQHISFPHELTEAIARYQLRL